MNRGLDASLRRERTYLVGIKYRRLPEHGLEATHATYYMFNLKRA